MPARREKENVARKNILDGILVLSMGMGREEINFDNGEERVVRIEMQIIIRK